LYLLLGDPQDACCQCVQQLLVQRNCAVATIGNPVTGALRFSWQLSTEQSSSRLDWSDGPSLLDGDIEGVLVRSMGWLDPAGWQAEDLMYVQAESQAALLAWLWSLPCPVINRLPPYVWYCPRNSIYSWQRLLWAAGLRTLEALLTNEETHAREFGQRLRDDGVAGVVFHPLTSDAHYLVTTEAEWDGLSNLQRSIPICLAPPHRETQSVCVIGQRVVWSGTASVETELESALQQFAKAAGIQFVELSLAETGQGPCVVAVDPQPTLEHFGNPARQQIVEALVHLLTETRDRAGSPVLEEAVS
jgi:hypothetical protein